MSAITIGIAGITGKFARLLATVLLDKYPAVSIRGLARRPSMVDILLTSSPKVQIFQGDAFDIDKIRQFVCGCDVVVCCYLGDDNLMVEGQKVLIDIAEEEHVSRYVASDWSLDWTKLKMGELFAKEPCQIVSAYLDTKESIKAIHVLVGGFIDVLFAPFFSIWEPSDNGTIKYWGEGSETWECTSYLNSAEYTAAVCVDREATGTLRCMFFLHSFPG